MSKRPTIHEYYLDMLDLVAARSTCVRRSVGAIITDENGKALGVGYNGVPRGFDHCTVDKPCLGAHDQPGDVSNCMAVHAEANALLQCGDLTRAFVMYCSNLPCFACAKMIANTTIEVVICKEDYADKRGLEILTTAGCRVIIAGELYEENSSETRDDG
jgi:dCMP deaminase